MIINPRISWRRDAAMLGLAIMFFFCIGLGARPYLTPSEARYIEIPQQMLLTGDWLTPRINGVPYFEKPPLFYWMQAVALDTLGMNQFAGRITTALLTTLTCLLAYATGRMLFGRAGGLMAAGILATSLMGFGLAHVAMLDVPVSFFITACLSCFLAAQNTADNKLRRNFYLLMYAASALAMMSKGLIGIVIPAMIIGIWIAMTGRWRIIKEAQVIHGIIIFLAIAAPWHVLMARQHPDFLNFYFIHEHFTRYLTDEHKRTAPWWFFIIITLAGLLPWTGVLPETYKNLDRKDPNHLFLILWVIIPLIFFSSSHSKLISYIFPIFPPLAVMCGHIIAKWWEDGIVSKSLRLNAVFIIILFGAAVIAAPMLPSLPGKAGHKLAMLAGITLPMLLPLIMALACLGYIVIRKRSARAHIAALALVGVSVGLTANFIVSPLDMSTVKPLAAQLSERLTPDDMVVAYGSYWQDLPVYLNRNITVAGWQGELAYSIDNYPETHEWMISTDEFWPRCATSTHSVYVFINEDMFAVLPKNDGCQLHIVAKYGKTLLLEKL